MFTPDHRPQQEGLEKCYVPISDGLLLSSVEYGWQPLPASSWRFANPQLEAPQHYIGRYFDKDCYVVVLEAQPDVHQHHWQNLRQLLGLLDEISYEVAARALQVVNWDRDHQFCGRCGSRTESHHREMAKHCQSCDALFYPRLSPCVITVVTRGEHCLLAHNPAFPSRFFSALAGFIEVGETIESALRREVREEVGIEVGKLEYFGSQAWPFPGQLMIGFMAEYQSGDIVVDGVEIEEANWYRYDELPLVPPAASLSGQLISHFVKMHKSAL
ncbi:NAD(+) diphosphatase [Aestuariicella hydrocarbonica]|uniref:NAD(+) diphosphatase n=1 Tax=Pseudomaricurvus hydrocarbonicus TaxID=1470433 RepID=A0A9E5JTS3_9GAMM|nr:NAD(+) diphosphatase [Aestuariicella hydrocarbonica]NHO65356.1 NAD(+) diphosphatase [Aestuariicella hydrocarbonica]